MHTAKSNTSLLLLLAILLVTIADTSPANAPPQPPGCLSFDSATVCSGQFGVPCDDFSHVTPDYTCDEGLTQGEATVSACVTDILQLNCAPGNPSSVIAIDAPVFNFLENHIEFNPPEITEAGTHNVAVIIRTACCVEVDYHGCYGSEQSVTLNVQVTAEGTAYPLRSGSTDVTNGSSRNALSIAWWQIDGPSGPCYSQFANELPQNNYFMFKYEASGGDKCDDYYQFFTKVKADYAMELNLNDVYWLMNSYDVVAGGRVSVTLPSGVLLHERAAITSDSDGEYGIGLTLGPIAIDIGSLFFDEDDGEVFTDSITQPVLSCWYPVMNEAGDDETWRLDICPEVNSNVKVSACPIQGSSPQWDPTAEVALTVSVSDDETRWLDAE